LHASSPLDAAIAYAEYGWRVVPLYGLVHQSDGSLVCECKRGRACPHPGKHPRLISWPTRVSNSPKKVRQWFEKWPLSNVGLVTGYDFVVLDLDPRNGSKESVDGLVARG